jgi:hypothetical protein
MRAPIGLLLLGLLVPAAPARADQPSLDDSQRTVCHGDRCVGSSCTQDGDALNCWKESVLQRKPGEEVHWVCTKHGHRCSWLHGPMPDTDKFGQFELSQ